MILQRSLISSLCLSLLLAGAATSFARFDDDKKQEEKTQQTQKPTTSKEVVNRVEVPRGTVLQVTLDGEINTRKAVVGDTVEALLSGADRNNKFPRLTIFIGRIKTVDPRAQNGGLTVRFERAILPDGTKVMIDGLPRPIQPPQTNQQAQKGGSGVAGGAAIGALAGMAVAGNNVGGALIGGTIGGGVAQNRRNRAAAQPTELIVKDGTRFELVLQQPAVIETKKK